MKPVHIATTATQGQIVVTIVTQSGAVHRVVGPIPSARRYDERHDPIVQARFLQAWLESEGKR